jgi:hypothetical protein
LNRDPDLLARVLDGVATFVPPAIVLVAVVALGLARQGYDFPPARRRD